MEDKPALFKSPVDRVSLKSLLCTCGRPIFFLFQERGRRETHCGDQVVNITDLCSTLSQLSGNSLLKGTQSAMGPR